MVVKYVLDGGLGTLVQSRGAFQENGDDLWVSSCLTTENGRQELKKAHLDYLRAGADIIKTGSYQISVPLLKRSMPDITEERCLDLMRQSVRIARSACQEYRQTVDPQSEPKVAASVGPYGACCADRSEYTGSYADTMTEADFVEWHRPRLTALLDAGVDFLAFETFPSLPEAKAVLRWLQENSPQTKAWVSFSCKDGSHLCHGEEFAGAVSQLWAMDVGNLVAVGVNCTHRDFITPLLKSLDEAHLSHVPVIIYPNGGEDYSQPGTTADTTGRSKTLGQLGLEWSAIHSNIFGMGGCCDYHPEDIGLLHRALRPL